MRRNEQVNRWTSEEINKEIIEQVKNLLVEQSETLMTKAERLNTWTKTTKCHDKQGKNWTSGENKIFN